MSRSESQGVAIIVTWKSGFHMIAKDRKESQLTSLSSNFKPNCDHGSEIIPRNNRVVIARSCKNCEQWFPLIAMDCNESQLVAEIENFLSLRLLATAIARSCKESQTNF